MRPLLVLFLALFAFHAAASDWVKFYRKYPDSDMETPSYFDRDSVRSGSGHKLVWIKTSSSPGDEFFHLEFDCQGRFMPHQAYDIWKDGTRKDFPKGYMEGMFEKFYKINEWYPIEPDTVHAAAEKAVCKQ